MRKKSNKKGILLAMVILFSFFTVVWTLNLRNGLVYDDYTTLTRAKFSEFSDLLTMFPSISYNDRPMGLAFIKILIQIFGTNYLLFHMVFVGFHLLNVFLLYCIVGLLFKEFAVEDELNIYGIIAASVFGVFPTSLMAVQWFSAVYDLLCCTALLLSVLFYLYAQREKKYCLFYSFMSFMTYWVSLRCKEMSLALPVIFLVYEVGVAVKRKEKLKIHYVLIVQFLFMVVYAILLFTGGQDSTPPDNPYYLTFNPVILIRNLVRYLSIYVDPLNNAYMYDRFRSSSLLGCIIFCILILYSFYQLIKFRNVYLLLCLSAIVGSIVIVLPMQNMQHRLYLYIPSIFIGIFVALVVFELTSSIKRIDVVSLSIVLLLLFGLTNYADGITGFRNSWLSVCDQDAVGINQINKLQNMPRFSHIYVKGAKDGYNVFYYGPGNSFRLLFNDETIKTELVDEFPKEPDKPYLFIEYEDGNIREIERNDIPIIPLKIRCLSKTNILLKSDDKTNFDVGLVGDYSFDDLELRINGECVQHFVGNDFISFTIPEELRIAGTQIRVSLFSNSAGGESNSKYIEIR